jgi:putative ABC transport system substrate-binding protein
LKRAALIDRRAVLGSFALGLLVGTRNASAQLAVAIPQIGLLRPNAPGNPVERAIVDAFQAGLREADYEPGKNIRVEIRYAEGKLDRLPAIARELAALPLMAIVTANPYSTRAVREATRTIPIVVALDYETDPVASGWIASLSRPGGNLTGLFLDQPEMSTKLLQLLKDCVPGLTKVAVLWDETIAKAQFDATAGAARASGFPLLSLRVRRPEDLGRAFDTAAAKRANGLNSPPRFGVMATVSGIDPGPGMLQCACSAFSLARDSCPRGVDMSANSAAFGGNRPSTRNSRRNRHLHPSKSWGAI